jgi:hypothetical protein
MSSNRWTLVPSISRIKIPWTNSALLCRAPRLDLADYGRRERLAVSHKQNWRRNSAYTFAGVNGWPDRSGLSFARIGLNMGMRGENGERLLSTEMV